MNRDLIDRVERCEIDNRRLQRRLFRQNLLWLIVAVVAAASTAIASTSKAPATSGTMTANKIRTHEIIVIDNRGTVRARLGGNLPDAVYNGKVLQRGSNAAGLMIYDKHGLERGGYVTFDKGDNIALTLDGGAAANNRQTALFVANPDGATALKLWNRKTKSAIVLRSDADGSRITAVKNGRAVFQKPLIGKIGTESCVFFRKFAIKHSTSKATAICRSRFSGNACHTCISEGQG